MTDFPTVQSDLMTGYAVNHTVYCSHGQMGEPTGSPHVRGIEFRLPRFIRAPVVSAEILGAPGSSMLAAYSVKVNDNVSGSTQVAIEAQTIFGGPAAGQHYCSIVVKGIPM